jgi:hypothetical protein
MQGKPLEPKYQGPFTIINKLGPVDYTYIHTLKFVLGMCRIGFFKPVPDIFINNPGMPVPVPVQCYQHR